MPDPTNDIDALLEYLGLIAIPEAPRYHRALAALVAERDKAKADFSEAWRERSEFAKRIDEADAALADVLKALQKSHDAMVLAQKTHNRMLLCDPPIDAWRQRCVDAHLGDAIRECAAAMRKGDECNR